MPREFQDQVLTQLGAIRADLDNIKVDLAENRMDHQAIFNRLGETEKCIEGIKVKTGILGSIVGGVAGIIAGTLAGIFGGRFGS